MGRSSNTLTGAWAPSKPVSIPFGSIGLLSYKIGFPLDQLSYKIQASEHTACNPYHFNASLFVLFDTIESHPYTTFPNQTYGVSYLVT